MKNLVYFLCFITWVSCTHPCANNAPQQFIATANPESVGFDAVRLQRIDSVLAGYVRDGVIPNGVSFVARNGRVVHHKAYGYRDEANNVPVSTTDIFRLASQTKAITTAVLMTLFEENRFLLDDPVENCLPMFAHLQVYVSGSVEEGNLVTRPAKGKITIRHLLSHTSGYSYGFFGEDLRVINYSQPVTTKEAMERIARTPLLHDPGERFTYGFGIDIAGYLAEVISGKTLDVLMKERIFDPLGMKDTYFYLPAEKHDRLVKMYTRPSDSRKYSIDTVEIEQIYPLAANQPYHGGGAGLNGTIEDYARFCQMILNKGEFNNRRILSPKTVELMGTNQLFDIAGDYKFGLGFEIYNHRKFVQNMATEASLGWGGAYGTIYLIDVKENMVLLFFTNVNNWANPGVQNRFMISVYQAMMEM
jgi:CubicO group peptidase (beta-lactamase class C family)